MKPKHYFCDHLSSFLRLSIFLKAQLGDNSLEVIKIIYLPSSNILRKISNRVLKSSFAMTEAVVRRCSVEKVFLEILQNSQENTCARASFLIKLQAY